MTTNGVIPHRIHNGSLTLRAGENKLVELSHDTPGVSQEIEFQSDGVIEDKLQKKMDLKLVDLKEAEAFLKNPEVAERNSFRSGEFLNPPVEVNGEKWDVKENDKHSSMPGAIFFNNGDTGLSIHGNSIHLYALSDSGDGHFGQSIRGKWNQESGTITLVEEMLHHLSYGPGKSEKKKQKKYSPGPASGAGPASTGPADAHAMPDGDWRGHS